MNFFDLMTQGGAVSQIVAVLLLAMSVASWVVILWKDSVVMTVELDLETREISHKSSSRATYAQGSLRAARFLHRQKTGLFDMFDVLDLK